MGKVKSQTTRTARHQPLPIQLEQDELGHGALSAPGRRAGKRRSDDGGERPGLSAKASKRILELAREQQLDEASDDDEGSIDLDPRLVARQQANGDAMSSDEGEEAGEEFEGFGSDAGDDVYEDLDIDAGDQAILDSFSGGGSRNLADLIMAKLDEHEAATTSKGKLPLRAAFSDEASAPSLDPKVVEVYTKVGVLLSRYRSGPLPKAFKILPSLRNWLQLVELTRPQSWTPHATFAATRIFASNLDPKQSQRFYREILYNRVRDEIEEHKELNVHLYNALKKALYKPAAFFKGVLFPLCESGTCTLREAAIVGSVITKVSIPVLHSGAALLKLASMDYTGPTSLFIRVLLDKKYALPYKVVDALVFHFTRFKSDARTMPVLWHQSLLVFVQRYKDDLAHEQKEALMDLIRAKPHAAISIEVRRELVHSMAAEGTAVEPARDVAMAL